MILPSCERGGASDLLVPKRLQHRLEALTQVRLQFVQRRVPLELLKLVVVEQFLEVEGLELWRNRLLRCLSVLAVVR